MARWIACALFVLLACSENEPRAKPVIEPSPVRAAATQTSAVAAPVAPSGPPVRIFAKRFVVKVRQSPSKSAFRLGYLRGGAVLQAKTAEPIGFDKCRKGWFELTTGGFVCSTVDAITFLGKRLPERQPLQPDLTQPLPYPYGYSRRRNTPMFRRLPSDEESRQYEGNAASVTLQPPPAPSTLAELDDAMPEPAEAPPLLQISGAPGSGSADAGVPTLDSLRGDEGTVLMRRMERGFFVSLDREMQRGARSYWRTQSNGFIPSQGLYLVHGSAFHGVELAGEDAHAGATAADQGRPALPIAFVMLSKALAYQRDARGRIKRAGLAGYHRMLRVASELDERRTRYYVDETGTLFRAEDVTRIDAREKPAEVGDEEKWIDVDLSAQSLVAYVGARPVYATLISSGRIKDPLDPLKNFETPSGAFRITSKHLSATMDGDHAIDGPYSIEDVPYVMYFQLAYAVHAAFWHDSFGRPRSHGCINLAPLDARWIFDFAEPPLPERWHGVYPRPDLPGTRLYIHGTTPKG